MGVDVREDHEWDAGLFELRYKGQPVPAHLKHRERINPALFQRWLARLHGLVRRELFRIAMKETGLECPKAEVAHTLEEALDIQTRVGYSTIIRESRDFSCVILDREGRLIVAPPMFFHAPVYRHLVGRILKAYGTDAIKDGDVFVSNHPYEGGLPHVSDMAFVAPVFAAGEIVALGPRVLRTACLLSKPVPESLVAEEGHDADFAVETL